MVVRVIDCKLGEVCKNLKNEVCFVKMVNVCWCEKWYFIKKL